MHFSISRQEVFQQTSRRMAWVGTRSEGSDNDFDRVSLSDADYALLHSLFDDAAMLAMDLCRPFLTAAANTDEMLSLSLSLREHQDADQLRLALSQMIEAHILGQWQEIVAPSRAPGAFARSDMAARKAAAILYHHRAPVRPGSSDN